MTRAGFDQDAAPEGRIALEGALNFRDVGGYPAAGGRTVRRGTLYRSGALARLTPADVDTLNGLRLGAIIDLRNDMERQAAPTPAALAAAAAIFPLALGTSEGVNGVPRPALLTVPEATPEQARTAIRDAYRRFALNGPERFAALFRRLLEGPRCPSVIHCTAGKDRTGVSVALVLLALGVPRDAVVEDYSLTRRYLDETWRERILVAMLGDLSTVNRPVAEVMFDASPDYISAFLDAIGDEYGSADRYLAQGVGLGERERARLRDLLLA
ncbi:MAG: hypothetical protein GC201_11465 [Alphaproteobacteria bacterium]|nr:hypothetical protein [Alphaproteobacteria bacterium]